MEKASNSFFAIMRPQLRKSNPKKYTGTDRLILDRDLMTLKNALNNKIQVGEENDWQLLLNRGICKEQHPAIATSPGSRARKRNTDS